jgi:hypothetical protein
MSELEEVRTSSFSGKTPGERLAQALAYAEARRGDDHLVAVVLDEPKYDFEGFPFSGMRVSG